MSKHDRKLSIVMRPLVLAALRNLELLLDGANLRKDERDVYTRTVAVLQARLDEARRAEND